MKKIERTGCAISPVFLYFSIFVCLLADSRRTVLRVGQFEGIDANDLPRRVSDRRIVTVPMVSGRKFAGKIINIMHLRFHACQ
jgi:hypothetical protein